MKKLMFVLIPAAFLASTGAISQSIHYAFEGKVTSVIGDVGSAIPVGEAIRGTYRFDYVHAIPGQSSGTPGQSGFYVQAFGGSEVGLPAPTGFVYSFTAQVGIFRFKTQPVNFYNVNSFVSSGSYPQPNLQAHEDTQTSATTGIYSSDLSLTNADGTELVSSLGYPVWTNSTTGAGVFFTYTDHPEGLIVSYTITSLTRKTVDEDD